jgi:hypothetical protein
VDWVVRAGIASPGSLARGYNQHRGVPGLFGFSVQYAIGRSVEELTLAGQFPHEQISHATDDALQLALQPLGYTMNLVRSPGRGYHHTFAVLYDVSGLLLQRLPQDAAIALSLTFRHRLNPYRIR